jgi:hypothetical protein
MKIHYRILTEVIKEAKCMYVYMSRHLENNGYG